MNAETTNQFFKEATISNIIMLAERIRGRESVSNLIQYTYKYMNKLTLNELETIRDGHIKSYNDLCRKGKLHDV